MPTFAEFRSHAFGRRPQPKVKDVFLNRAFQSCTWTVFFRFWLRSWKNPEYNHYLFISSVIFCKYCFSSYLRHFCSRDTEIARRFRGPQQSQHSWGWTLPHCSNSHVPAVYQSHPTEHLIQSHQLAGAVCHPSEIYCNNLISASSSCLHDRATVRSGAGTPQVPWQVSGVVQKLAYWVLGSVFPRVRH